LAEKNVRLYRFTSKTDMSWAGCPNADAAQDALKSVGKNSRREFFRKPPD